MTVKPTFEDFAKGYEAGRAQLVWTSLVSDLETPVSAMRRQRSNVRAVMLVWRKLPVSVLFDLIRALNENMTKYEQVYGPIVRPGDSRPTFPPDDLVGG